MLLKLLKQSFFLLWSFSQLVVYFLFNVIVHKEKLKLLIKHEFYCSTLYCAMPVWNANIWLFNSYVELLVFHSLYVYISFLPEQGKHCTKLTCCFYFISYTCTFYQQSLPLIWQDWKEKELWLALSFPFLLCCHF